MMNNTLLAALAALSISLFTGCLDDAAPDADRDVVELDDRIDLDGEIDTSDRTAGTHGRPGEDRKTDEDETPEAPRCDQIIETDGACAAACDEEKLMGFIPEGTCAAFNCTLDDGRTMLVGGCNQ